jgi:hypothetical protein
MSVLPHNIYTGAGGDVDFYRSRIKGRFHKVDVGFRSSEL